MTYVSVLIGMLDPIKISYKLTTNMSVTYYRIQQYPVNTFYNKTPYPKPGNRRIQGWAFLYALVSLLSCTHLIVLLHCWNNLQPKLLQLYKKIWPPVVTKKKFRLFLKLKIYLFTHFWMSSNFLTILDSRKLFFEKFDNLIVYQLDFFWKYYFGSETQGQNWHARLARIEVL